MVMSSRRNRSRCRGLFDQLEQRGLLTLVLSPINVNATAQVPFSNVVATLVDSDHSASPSDFNNPPGSVQVNWGDGVTSAGLVVGPISPGVFYVDASHAYADTGSFSTLISVNDQSGNSAIASGLATVTTSAPPELTIAANTIKGSAGTALTGVAVANFLDPNPADLASDFQALITWGNGNTSIGLIQGGNGAFTVYGTNTYGAQGTYDTTVTVISTNNGLDGFASGTAKIGPTSTYGLTGQQFTANAGASFNVTVATFTDANLGDTASDFGATIDWGDGSPSTVGTITLTGTSTVDMMTVNDFSISGSHVYATPGTESLTVTLIDQHNSMSYTMSTANVSGAVLTPLPTTFNASLDQPFSGIVGSFFDTNTADSTATLSATITWGNGNVTQGMLKLRAGFPELWDVYGTNTYTTAGTYPVSIAVSSTANNQSTSVASTAVVAAPTLTGTGTTFPATPGVLLPTDTVVANFIDTNPNATITNLTALINWGDGQPITTGTVKSAGPPDVYTVTGSHLYASASATGSYHVTVTIGDPDGASIQVGSTAFIASPLAASGTNFSATVGQPVGTAPLGATVATFTDMNANAADSTVVINWGDGTSSPGHVTGPNPSNLYTVSGNHTYLIASATGEYTVTVTITDPSGQTATVSSTAFVAAPVLSGIPLTVNFTAGTPPSSPVIVGSFFDTNSGATAADFTVSINWGAGQSSTGIVTASSATPGLFLVSGAYLYPAAGNFNVTISVYDNNGNSTFFNSLAIVATNVATTSPNIDFTGGLDPVAVNGPHAAIGYTATNQPTFSGTAVPFAVVQLYGTYRGVDAVQSLGEAVTNASGQWALTVGPLAAGTYTITAMVTPPGGYPITFSLTRNDVVHIYMAPPKHPKVVHHAKASKRPGTTLMLRPKAHSVHTQDRSRARDR